MRRLIALAAIVVLATALPARADAPGYGGNVDPKGDPVAFVSSPGADPIGTGGGTGSVECYLYDILLIPLPFNIFGLGIVPEPTRSRTSSTS